MIKKSEENDRIVIGQDYVENAVPGISFDMVYVKGCTFRSVPLSDYYIGKYVVTQGLWEAVMGTTVEEQEWKYPGITSCLCVDSNGPMYYVSWREAQMFCTKLSQLTGRKYVLPTELQWEYAALGGIKSKGYKYSGGNIIDEVAWFDGNVDYSSKYVPSLVGRKLPNELGIYDMSGNIWEWCDNYVLRGGSIGASMRDCQVSNREGYFDPDYGNNEVGFRIALLL